MSNGLRRSERYVQRLEQAIDGPAPAPAAPRRKPSSRPRIPVSSSATAGIESRNGVVFMDPPSGPTAQMMQLRAMENAGGIPKGSASHPKYASLRRKRQ